MISHKLVAAGIALQLMAATPAMAQNAHLYSGGPKTEVPHTMKNPSRVKENTKRTENTGHHYNGGPRSDPHHMGERK